MDNGIIENDQLGSDPVHGPFAGATFSTPKLNTSHTRMSFNQTTGLVGTIKREVILRRKIWIIFLIFVIIFCLYGCNSKEKKVKKLLDSGATKVEVGDYRGAIEDYSKVIHNYSKTIEINYILIAAAFVGRGSAKSYIYDFRGAIEDYDKAIEINPTFVYAYISRGYCKCLLNDYIGGIEDYNKAIEINNKDAEVYFERGRAKFQLNDYRDAIEDYDRAIEINPKYADAYAGRGLSKLMLKDKNGGCLDLSKAGELGFSEAYDLIKKWCPQSGQGAAAFRRKEMTTATIICLYLSAFPIFAAGYIFFSYGPYAEKRGWPAGAWFQTGKLAMPGASLMLAAIAWPVINHSWFALVLVPLCGFTLAFILTQALGPAVQLISLLMAFFAPASYFVCLNYVR
jgi:hypothetical protein